MTLIKLSGLVSDEAGHLNGSIIQRNHAGLIMRNLKKPKNTKTIYTASMRGNWGMLQNRYNNLTLAQIYSWMEAALKITWHNKLGEPYHPTGQQLYLQSNQNIYAAGGSTVDYYTNPSISPIITSASLTTFNAGDTSMLLNVNITGNTTGFKFLVYASKSLSLGINYAYKYLKLVKTVTVGTSGDWDIYSDYIARFGRPNGNKKIFFAIRPVEVVSGNQGQKVYFNSVVQSHAFTPTDLAGCKLWLQSDIGVIKDGSNNVSGWIDNSGCGNNAVIHNPGFPPIFIPSVLDGFGSIRSTGYYDGLSFPELSDIRSVFIVLKHSTGSQDYTPVLGDAFTYYFAAGAGSNLISNISDMRTGRGFLNGNEITPVFSMVKPTIFSLIELITASNATAQYLGNDRNIPDRYWSGDFVEIIIYNQNLNDTDRLKVESYILQKYPSIIP